MIVLVLSGSYYGYNKLREENPYFTVVVDCGSTGTRVNVYEWRLTGGGNGDLPNLLHSYPDDSRKSPMWNNGCHYHCLQTEPGLDEFVRNSSGVRASLDPLIHWAEGLVPQNRHRDTPVLVLATAGLRRLPEEDAKRVLEDVENVIKEHSFMWRRDWIRVLSGREEAQYGWIALNYKMGRLISPSRLPTLGLLDLGGSSLQIVMEAGDTRKDGHLLISKIGHIEHQLIAYSLPSFGLNKAFDRTVSMLTQVNSIENEGGSEVRHPCLSSRFVGNYSCSSCSKPYSLLRLVGDPNWEKCKIVAKAAAMNRSFGGWSGPRIDSSCRRDSPTDGKNVLNIHINTYPGVQYHALSGFFAVYNMLNLTAKANLTKIWEKAQDLCSHTWDDLENSSGSQYCFKVLYLAFLLEDALCLGEADIIFGPGDISWTLGASLVGGEHLWRRNRGSSIVITAPQYIEVISSPIVLFIILLVLLFVVYHCQIKLPKPRKRSVVGEPLPSYNYPKHRLH